MQRKESKFKRDNLYELVRPGCKVKVKFKDEIVTAVIVKVHFISKLSYDCHYFFATAKADVNLPDVSSTREFQLRDLKVLIF